MKIGIQTWGSHGDIRPFIALAEGLQKAGHQVTLYMTSVVDVEYSTSISKSGVYIEQIASDIVNNNIKNKDKYAEYFQFINEKNPLKQIKLLFSEFFLPVENEMYEASVKLCQINDIVIGHTIQYTLQTAAEITKTPHISVMLAHIFPTTNQPPVGFPRIGKWGNIFFWWLMRTILNKSLKPTIDMLRIKHGLEVAKDLLTDVWSSSKLTLIAVSPEICKQQDDWPKNIQVCGFLNMENTPNEGSISVQLEHFLDEADPPIYMNFGSMIPPILQIQKETIQLFEDASKLSNCRAIIQMPLWEECQVKSSKIIHYVTSSPHHLIFPRCKAVVHHGGAGTTQTTMLAGIPSIPIAHTKEQEFWGLELKRLDIAPNLLIRRKVTPRKLAERISTVVNSPTMQENAQKIAQLMKIENGVSKAVELINRKFN